MPTKRSRRDFLTKMALSGTVISAGGLASGVDVQAREPAEIKVPRRRLGRTGAEVSLLALGLGQAFTVPFHDNQEAAEKILLRAVEYGINYWDTARYYGPSETMLGPVVERIRDKLFLVSKSAKRSYDGFKAELEMSLKNLRTDHIDLYHIHNLKPSKDTDLDYIESGAVRAAREAKEQGLIKNFGITGHSGAEIFMAGIKRWDPDAIMTIFPANRPDNGAYEDRLLPLARKRNMGVIAMKTVRWARNADITGPRLIRYALSLQGIASAVVGLDSMAHLDENTAMTSNFEPFSSEEMRQLTRTVRGKLSRVGPPPWYYPDYDDCVIV